MVKYVKITPGADGKFTVEISEAAITADATATAAGTKVYKVDGGVAMEVGSSGVTPTTIATQVETNAPTGTAAMLSSINATNTVTSTSTDIPKKYLIPIFIYLEKKNWSRMINIRPTNSREPLSTFKENIPENNLTDKQIIEYIMAFHNNFNTEQFREKNIVDRYKEFNSLEPTDLNGNPVRLVPSLYLIPAFKTLETTNSWSNFDKNDQANKHIYIDEFKKNIQQNDNISDEDILQYLDDFIRLKYVDGTMIKDQATKEERIEKLNQYPISPIDETGRKVKLNNNMIPIVRGGSIRPTKKTSLKRRHRRHKNTQKRTFRRYHHNN